MSEEKVSVPIVPVMLLMMLSLVVVLWAAQGMIWWEVLLLSCLEVAKIACMVAILAGIKKISRES